MDLLHDLQVHDGWSLAVRLLYISLRMAVRPTFHASCAMDRIQLASTPLCALCPRNPVVRLLSTARLLPRTVVQIFPPSLLLPGDSPLSHPSHELLEIYITHRAHREPLDDAHPLFQMGPQRCRRRAS